MGERDAEAAETEAAEGPDDPGEDVAEDLGADARTSAEDDAGPDEEPATEDDAGPDDEPAAGDDADDDGPNAEPTDGTDVDDHETLRAAVEATYDFDDFRPADMAEMSVEEWEAVFDPETWITGPELVDRVEAELRARAAGGELFGVVERHVVDGDHRLLVYSDAEYAVVRADGTVEGEGGLRRDVEPVVALCSMDSFEVAEPPGDAGLPDPSSIEPGSGDLGHRLLLVLAAVQLVAGLVLLVAPLAFRLGPGTGVLAAVVGLGFLVIGLVLGLVVANARLADRFRASEYRDRLRAAGVGTDERPSFLPAMDGGDGGAEAADDPLE